MNLLDAYPGAKTAVAWYERIVATRCTSEPNEPSAHELAMEKDFSLQELLEVTAAIAADELTDPECKIPKHVMRDVLAQLNTPDFRRYLMGKMGMV
jgi:hypothetical protein